MADLSEKLKREKKKVVKVANRKITIGKLLNDFLEDKIEKEEMREIVESETELGEQLRKIFEATDSFKVTKKYAQYLITANLKHSTANLAKFLEENQEKDITHRVKERKTRENQSGDEEDEEEEDIDDESESGSESDSESDEEEDNQMDEIFSKLSPTTKEFTNMLRERIKREEDSETQRLKRVKTKSKKSPSHVLEKQRTVEVSDMGKTAGDVIEYVSPPKYEYFERSDRQLKECTREYIAPTWLNSGGKRVVGVYCDNRDFGKKSRRITYMGEKWYAVNKKYFIIQCKTPRELKTQRGDMMVFGTGKSEKTFKILYKFNDNTFSIQNEAIFSAEKAYFIERYASPEQRKDLLLSEPFDSEHSNIARNLGRLQFKDIPDGDAIEKRVAITAMYLEDPSVMNYFREIAKISAYFKDNSVFKQRLQMGYYSGVDITTLSDYDKFDYPELEKYYDNVYLNELYSLEWSLYDLTYKGAKHFNKPVFDAMERPEIVNENLDGTMIFYDGNILSIDSILENGIKSSAEFAEKIKKMHKPRPTKVLNIRVKPVVPDIFQVLQDQLKQLKEKVVPTLAKSDKLDEFISLYMQ